MKLLLDTHALLWWLDDDARLGFQARDVIADPASHVLVSVVSLREVVVKIRAGKLRADVAEIARAAEEDGFALLAIAPAHLTALARLPFHADHRDPFDHLLVAQAVVEGATFVSEDRHAPRYAARVLPCSDA